MCACVTIEEPLDFATSQNPELRLETVSVSGFRVSGFGVLGLRV